MVWHAGLLHKLKFYEMSGRLMAIFCLFSVIDGFEWFWIGSLYKSIQSMLGLFRATFLVLHVSYYIYELPDDVICSIAIYVDDTTHYVSDFGQQLELASELESVLRDTVDYDRKCPVNFSMGKTQLVLFDQSNNSGAIDVKMDGSVLEEK